MGCKSEITDDDAGPACLPCLDSIPVLNRFSELKTDVYLASVSLYENILLKDLIHAFKYENASSVERSFKILIDKFAEKINIRNIVDPKEALVIPIPLHKKRQRLRGFNQAEIAAEYAAEKFNLPLRKDLLFRIKNTKPQIAAKNEHERKENLIDAFSVIDKKGVEGKDIVLVDDVFTSGATAMSAIKELRKAGARRVVIFVMAKT